MIDWRDYEVLTFEQAIKEMRIEPVRANEYANLAEIDRDPKCPNTRDDWVRVLGPMAIADLYNEHNSTERAPRNVIFRAMNAYDFVATVRTALEAKRVISRPNEFLKAIRSELHRRLNDPLRHFLGSPERIQVTHLIYGIPEVAGVLLASSNGRHAPPDEMLQAVNAVIKQRGKKGRPRLSYEHEAYDVLRENFEWLTGTPPRWSNAMGLEGDFIDFARPVYRSVGIAEPSERMLRPRRY